MQVRAEKSRPSHIACDLQGALGDCYLLSALAVMATTPDSIKKLFLRPQWNASGAFVVKLFKNGRWLAALP